MPQLVYDNISKDQLAFKRAKDLEWKKFVDKMDKLNVADSARPSRKQFETPFDPEGSGYDYVSAVNAGLVPLPDEKGEYHWDSRIPDSGLLLKGRKHKTWGKLEQGEKKAGYEIFKKSSPLNLGKYRYYSRPSNNNY